MRQYEIETCYFLNSQSASSSGMRREDGVVQDLEGCVSEEMVRNSVLRLVLREVISQSQEK